MGFGKNGLKTGFATVSRKYSVGYGLVIDLEVDLPRKFDETVMGGPDHKGLMIRGHVVAVLGASGNAEAPVNASTVNVLVRPGDDSKLIFEDMDKTKEVMRFFLEGVNGTRDALLARWVHGAGMNRSVEAIEFVGPPHLSFENPFPGDGPKNGYLSLNLDGSSTVFDIRGRDGTFVGCEMQFGEVVERLRMALDKNMKLRVSQRAVMPSRSVLVDDDAGMSSALTQFRTEGFNACVVRSFIPGTESTSEVDVQTMSWPDDIADGVNGPGQKYEMPSLQETKKFVALRDGDAQALMEVMPGFIVSLIGNSDTEKSTKHKFARNVVKGLSEGQKNMYAMQGYGPAIAIYAVNELSEKTGLTRLCVRTEGAQYGSLMTIPSVHFLTADKVKSAGKTGG